ncbi:MAG: BMP family ABC transporter substrate-binding protein [Actinomycetota bacterium]|nr:BMP family ABC transporter substrate-binding protein [Actinomycetota bacterium]
MTLVASVPASGATAASSSARVAPRAPSKSVTFVSDVGGLNDHGYNEFTYLGVKAGAAKEHMAWHVIQTQDPSQYVQNITTAAQQSGLVICSGFAMGDALKTVAARFPKTHFVILDYSYSPPLKNVQADVFDAQQSSYLAGIVAAGVSKTHTVGFVGGVDESVLQEFLAGYEAGALAENPKTHVKVEWTGSFTNEQAGKAAAQAEIAQGADVVYTAAGGSGIGGIDAAQAAHVFAIGVDADQNYLAPSTVITSAVKELGKVAEDNIAEFAHNTWKSGTTVYDLANHGVGLASFHGLAKDVPAQVRQKVAAATKAIASGSIVVPTTPKYPNGH